MISFDGIIITESQGKEKQIKSVRNPQNVIILNSFAD